MRARIINVFFFDRTGRLDMTHSICVIYFEAANFSLWPEREIERELCQIVFLQIILHVVLHEMIELPHEKTCVQLHNNSDISVVHTTHTNKLGAN